MPEYLRPLLTRYPAFQDDAVIIASIGSKINHFPSRDDHTDVCINQCRLAWEWLNSIHCLVAYDYCLGAASLCRNLFELIAGTIFLIENPSKLQDFIDYGKMIAYEVVEATAQSASGIAMPGVPVPDARYLQAFRAKADYDNVKKRFGRDKWHGKSLRRWSKPSGWKHSTTRFTKRHQLSRTATRTSRWATSKADGSFLRTCEVGATTARQRWISLLPAWEAFATERSIS